jgi:hypothetical protein
MSGKRMQALITIVTLWCGISGTALSAGEKGAETAPPAQMQEETVTLKTGAGAMLEMSGPVEVSCDRLKTTAGGQLVAVMPSGAAPTPGPGEKELPGRTLLFKVANGKVQVSCAQ